MSNYSIVSGDCLYSIVSQKYGLKSEEDIQKAIKSVVKENKIKNPDLIYAGDTLKLPEYESIFGTTQENSQPKTTVSSSEPANDSDSDVPEDDFNNWIKTGYAKLNADDEYEVEDYDMVDTDISYKDPAFLDPWKEGVSKMAQNELDLYDADEDGGIGFQEFSDKEVSQYYDLVGSDEWLNDEKNGTGFYSQETRSELIANFMAMDANGDQKLDKDELSAMYAALDGYDSSDGSVDGKIQFASTLNASPSDSKFQKLFAGALKLFAPKQTPKNNKNDGTNGNNMRQIR